MTDKSTPEGEIRMMQVTHDHLLNEAVKITQPADGYRVGTDAVLLAAAISTSSGRVLDLGAGVGGVCLCLAHRHHELQVTAVEKHADLAAMAQENAEVNGVANRLRILTTDIRELPPVLAGSFDHVVSNPPYHNSHGTRPRNADRALAHMGEDTDMVDWVKAAVWAAKPRAKITFICRADRVPELIALFDANGGHFEAYIATADDDQISAFSHLGTYSVYIVNGAQVMNAAKVTAGNVQYARP